jgi:16S rRNA U516 pseudouridylate synthase RsuA-like enzyme
MLESVHNKVVYLKRLRIWDWNLDWINPWEWKLVEV